MGVDASSVPTRLFKDIAGYVIIAVFYAKAYSRHSSRPVYAPESTSRSLTDNCTITV